MALMFWQAWYIFFTKKTQHYTFFADNDSAHLNRWKSKKPENVSEIFNEYTYKPNDKFDFIAGIQADRNNFYKLSIITPRAHLRYNFHKNSAIRASIGRGLKSPNAICRKHRNARHRTKNNDKQKPKNRKIVDNGSKFYTKFQSQIIVDYEFDEKSIMVGNPTENPMPTHTK